MENKFSFQTKNEMAQIKLAIFELGLTQKKIAQAIGIAEGFVSEILRGKKKGYRTLLLIKTELAREILKEKRHGHSRMPRRKRKAVRNGQLQND